jgi:hypothetical protein
MASDGAFTDSESRFEGAQRGTDEGRNLQHPAVDVVDDPEVDAKLGADLTLSDELLVLVFSVPQDSSLGGLREATIGSMRQKPASRAMI